MKLPPSHVAGVGLVKASGFGGVGQKLMESMGWTKGQGLGKEKNGMREALQAKKKEDVLGVGAAEGWDWSHKFWETAYDSTAQQLQNGGTGVSDGGSSSSSSDSSDDEAPVRRGRRQHRDGTIASASEAELRIAAELAKDPWGRWGGRAGKLGRIKQQEELQAAARRSPVVGATTATITTSSASDSDNVALHAAAPQPAVKPTKRSRKAEAAEAEPHAGTAVVEQAVLVSARMSKKARRTAEAVDAPVTPAANCAAPSADLATKRARVILHVKDSHLQTVAPFVPTPASGWWGARTFVSAGALEGMEQEVQGKKKAVHPLDNTDSNGQRRQMGQHGEDGSDEAKGRASRQQNGFTEDDQTALYMAAHDNKRVGMKGLGQSSTIKIAGGKWEGSRVKFDDGDGLATAAEAAAALAVQGQAAPEEAVPMSHAAAANSTKSERPKWLKMSRAHLKQAPDQRMSLKRLIKRLLSELATDACDSSSSWRYTDIEAALLKKVASKPDRFQLSGKHIVFSSRTVASA